MTEEKLYSLAHEALLNRWYKAHELLEKHKESKPFKTAEKETWDELFNFEVEMFGKGYKWEC